MDEPLFKSTRAALVFAFDNGEASAKRPAMNTAAAPSSGSGKGLGGIDGAAQRGMIRSMIRRCGVLSEAILIARFAPSVVVKYVNPSHCVLTESEEWANAVNMVTIVARDEIKVVSLKQASHIARREFSNSGTMQELAELMQVSLRTAERYCQKFYTWLRGDRKQLGVEDVAFEAIDYALRNSRPVIVGA